jgi:hypothetical protein
MDNELTINNMETILKNENVLVEYDIPNLCITWYDLKDLYNDFKGFTRNKRNLYKASVFIKQLAQDERLKDDLKMGDITDIMEKFKLKPHTYCGMD